MQPSKKRTVLYRKGMERFAVFKIIYPICSRKNAKIFFSVLDKYDKINFSNKL